MSGKIKIAIFWGTFDPFHNDDKKVLEELVRSKRFNHVVVMPLGLAPYNDKYMTPSGYRYEMARLGIRGLPGSVLSDYEINRPGQYSHTIDTIDFFKGKYRAEHTGKVKVEVSLVYDSDALDTIEYWHKPEQIMKKAGLLICRRESDNFEHMKERAAYLRTEYQADIGFFKVKGTGKYQKGKMPPAVRRYIRKNKIYAFSNEMAQLNHQQLIQLAIYEKEVRKNVSRFKFNHSLNVMQYAVHLAARHDYNLMKAATAGILHDIAKSMKLAKQYRLAKKQKKSSPLNKNGVHGAAGAWYAHHHLGITNKKVLDALTFHTTPRENMTKLDKIVYLADKLEHGRTIRKSKKVRRTAETDLTSAMKLCLKDGGTNA
ncbi:MAG: bis(5'-nucleosyl)-tetraphosphatase (symmetrical) YqeK [Lentihominibacter sp.]